MAKRRIVVLSDGTGNSSAAVWRTNVWRTFEALDLSNSDQVALYDDGVGTSTFKPLALLGGAFGFGLKRNVIDIYKFVCRNYRDDDNEIFGFGFSRGAFTIRVVVGLILDQGLVQATNETDLDHLAKAAYRDYRRRKYHTVWWELFHKDRKIPPSTTAAGNRHVNNIRFLGLWDTVAAYGLPVDEMTRGVNKWIWPLELPNRVLNPRVQRACHALALDDERTTFHPVLWDESAELTTDSDQTRLVSDERISQVWFSGMHSNVGGGYPDDSLARIPQYWIMTEAQKCGLQFKSAPNADPDSLINTSAARDKDGRLYDSRSGLGGYYRYGPRHLAELCHDKFSENPGDQVNIRLPKIHESVFKRVQNNAHPCAPLGIPAGYEVVTDTGQILPASTNPYETLLQSEARAKAQESVWNTVWKRRIVYFLTVLATAALVIFPLLKSLPASDEYSSPVRWISDLIRLLSSFLPSVADPWVNGYARSPITFVILAAVAGALTSLGVRLASQIKSDMGSIWQSTVVDGHAVSRSYDNWIYRLRNSPAYVAAKRSWKFSIGPGLSTIFFLYAGVMLLNHLAYIALDDAGFVCSENAASTRMAKGETRVFAFNTSSVCSATGILLENGGRYAITIKSKEASWYDRDIPTSLAGFYSLDAPRFWQKGLMVLAVPMRRELIRPWFRIVARTGGTGGEESFLDPDPKDHTIDEVLHATRDGELFLFVNDAVIGVPGLAGAFYANNIGTADVAITRR
ncbi:DUF2235 domain-containing protein [Bradyrhizobium erythrophlei]|uniref:Uncharacterized alpha/beta hydrolase domain n=1 Tax=Bradyrhizobium erythrophlei TaxID=1437360 RepID=A0A1M5JYL3_9BRAD|nr:DUF2235 domain-containing protein [Bradyrhizobium erythrophlei]SHG45400.1 Uncharacterized alpha/beta hydrolase domain [Bradyrhizobium erythrophlei]